MKIRLNSREQEELVLKNQKLVYHLAKKFVSDSNDLEELGSIGKVGLVKAAATFNKSKGISFSAYAGQCIQNEIRMHIRKEKKRRNIVLLDDPVADDGKGNEITFGETIEDSSKDFREIIGDQEIIIKLINIILNILGPKEKLVMLYKISGMNQTLIGQNLNISRSYVSRIELASKNKLKQYFSSPEHFKTKLSIELAEYSYKIVFDSKDVNNFNMIFASFLQKLTSTEILLDFRVVKTNKKVIIEVPAHQKSFALIAKIIEEIDNYCTAFCSEVDNIVVE